MAGIGLNIWDPVAGQRYLNPDFAHLHRPQHIDRPGAVAPGMPKVASAPAPSPGPGGPPPYTSPSDGSAGSGGTQPIGSPHGATAPGSSPDQVKPPPLIKVTPIPMEMYATGAPGFPGTGPGGYSGGTGQWPNNGNPQGSPNGGAPGGFPPGGFPGGGGFLGGSGPPGPPGEPCISPTGVPICRVCGRPAEIGYNYCIYCNPQQFAIPHTYTGGGRMRAPAPHFMHMRSRGRYTKEQRHVAMQYKCEDEEKVYQFKLMQAITLPAYPRHAGEMKFWIEKLLNAICKLDQSGKHVL